MKKIIFMVVMGGVLFTPYYSYGGWRIETIDSNNAGAYSSLKIDKKGHSHISYLGNGVLKYASWNDSSWSTQIVDNSGTPVSTSLALNLYGAPSISYIVASNLKYSAYTNGTWSIQIVDSGGISGLSPLEIDNQNHLHISYGKGGGNNYYYLQYAYWNGSSWNKEGVTDGSGGGVSPSIAIDKNNYPHIVFFQDRDGGGTEIRGIKYVYWTGSSWTEQYINAGADAGYWCSIKLNSNDYPHISCYDNNNQDLKYLYWTGANWQIQTVDSVGNVGEFTSLVLDSNNRPHISYYDRTNGDLKYAYRK